MVFREILPEIAVYYFSLYENECKHTKYCILLHTYSPAIHFYIGDICNVLKTVSGIDNREHSKKRAKKLHFVVNDIDPDILARDLLLLEIIHTLDVKKVCVFCFITVTLILEA